MRFPINFAVMVGLASLSSVPVRYGMMDNMMCLRDCTNRVCSIRAHDPT